MAGRELENIRGGRKLLAGGGNRRLDVGNGG